METLKKLLNHVHILNALHTLDDGLVSLESYQRFYSVVSEAVEMMGYPVRGTVNCCPVPATKKLQEASTHVTKYILKNHKIEPLRSSSDPAVVLGYHTDVEETIKFLVGANAYTPSLYNSKAFDTLVLAFAYDKAPFLHSG
jgi:hypothetical protein